MSIDAMRFRGATADDDCSRTRCHLEPLREGGINEGSLLIGCVKNY
jgi:hypothetical protein